MLAYNEILNQNEKMKNTIESNSLSANIFRTTRKENAYLSNRLQATTNFSILAF